MLNEGSELVAVGGGWWRGGGQGGRVGCRITLECEGCLSTAAGGRWEREKRRKAEESEEFRQSERDSFQFKLEMFVDPAGRSRISRVTPDHNNKRVGLLWSVARFGPRRCRRCRGIKSY